MRPLPPPGAPLFVRRLAVPPELPRLLAAFEGAPLPQVLWSADGSGPSYLMAEPIAEASELDPEPALPLGSPLREHAEVPRWVGVLPYEACRALERSSDAADLREPPWLTRVRWYRYGAVARVFGDEVTLIGDHEPSLERLSSRLIDGARSSSRPWGSAARVTRVPDPADDPAAHRARIERALTHIAAGDIYQVNLARRFSYIRAGGHLALLAAAAAHGVAPYAAALTLGERQVVSLSPELFLSLEPGGELTTIPIKGTRPRGHDAAADLALQRELDQDPKERAELAMILDVERNDLGRVAVTGSVQLADPPYIATHPTLHHRQARLTATLRPELGRAALLRAMLPSGSVTGAPKVRAMELIARLEPVRRGLYTGAYGHVSHDGGLTLAMAIRTLCLTGELGRYHVGGGIVADSDPERELEETEWKALAWTRLASTA
ncbi:MAG: anthranilate synthase component I family protein [Polyangiaceae bacterium]|nr:anthranilate synthase component I family protein [Polyangiaceae bacterium]MCW5791544.1 anthranilate synthase component I family protein [Polyangiaceae bacterium]